MSEQNEDVRNPLQREGTTQPDRFPEALHPEFAKLDDQDLYDYLDFIYRYSEHINYWPKETKEELNKITKKIKVPKGLPNWQLFFSCGIIMLSHISKSSSVKSNLELKGILKEITESNVKEKSREVEKTLLNLSKQIEKWLSGFHPEDPFKEVLSRTLKDEHFKKLIKVIRRIKTDFKSHKDLDRLKENYLSANSEVVRIYEGLVLEAEKELELRLAEDQFDPHIGLLLSYLKLFETSRDNLNNLTERHLRFYYEDILQLQKKDFVADEAHLTLGLAKNTDEHKITQGTLFKGGKDSLGNEISYELTEDFIANKSSISEIRSSFLIEDKEKKVTTFKAAYNAQTKDGLEEALDEEDPKWAPFTNENYQLARRGFAVSSPILRLKTGNKSINIIFTLNSVDNLDGINKDDFSLFYSGKAKWIEKSITAVTVDKSQKTIDFEIILTSTEDSVLDYNSIEMEDSESFDTKWPVFKFILTEDGQNYHAAISKLQIKAWDIKLSVTDIRDAVILNDNGAMKVDKPFMPFGATPVVGSQFYLGHPEVFSKNIDYLDFSWDWVDAPANLSSYYSSYTNSDPVNYTVKPYVLDDKDWNEIKESKSTSKELLAELAKKLKISTPNIALNDFFENKFKETLNKEVEVFESGEEVSISLSASNKFLDAMEFSLGSSTKFEDEQDFKDLSTDLNYGFVKLKLDSPGFAFGHKDYPKLLQQAVIEETTGEKPNTTQLIQEFIDKQTKNLAVLDEDSLKKDAEDYALQVINSSPLDELNQPYTPVWENLKLEYHSSVNSETDSSSMTFFALEEFGHETNFSNLIPEYNEQARLYIGLEEVNDGSSISLLIQFAEGTANPFSAASPDFNWRYLSKSGWQEFESEDLIKDTTVKLLQSGIVRFGINEADLEHSQMPDGLFWLRLEINNDPSLYNQFIAIFTQATTVRFKDNNNSLEHLDSALPAGTISKLKVKDPAVKTILQPFSSYGGSGIEKDENYFVRISERLRHKDRAIQIWDYEHLILNNFPEIYKVKCLNHTGKTCEKDSDNNYQYSEVSPGDVTVVAIPDMSTGEQYNYFRPAVKFATLEKISEFLKERCSSWVTLDVRNPKYEELYVSAKVHFYDFISDTGFYETKLKEDINSFLTPWVEDIGSLPLGGKIFKSTILNFIEEREYVDYLIDFDVKLKIGDEMVTFEEEITPSTSFSLIVPGTEHKVISF